MKIALVKQQTGYENHLDSRQYLDKLKRVIDTDADIIAGPELAIANKLHIMNPHELVAFCENIQENMDGQLILPGTALIHNSDKKTLRNTAPYITKDKIGFIDKRTSHREKEIAKELGLFYESNGTIGIIPFKGYYVGVSICKDHPQGVLKKVAGSQKINIEIVLACGLYDILEDNFAVKDGLFCLNDGAQGGRASIYAFDVNSRSDYKIRRSEQTLFTRVYEWG